MDKDAELMENHRQNYRMAFDAMRAYHSSEIEHKKDMITILNGILVAIITIYAGVFSFILSKDIDSFLILISMIVVVIIGLLLFLLLRGLMNTSKDKIYSDHNRYERFRNECLAEREILEIEKDINLKTAGRQLYWNIPVQINLQGESTRLGSGESKTIDILKTYSNILVAVIGCLTVISLALLINKYL